MAETTADESVIPIQTSTIRKIYFRLIPLLFCMMFVNYLDRINLGFAGLQMIQDLKFSSAVFGLGGSVFFLGYMVLQIPSNLILFRFGARHWLGGILTVWGFVAAAMAFVGGQTGFHVLRFLLGVAEAGLLPGLALYVTFWFPSRYRARAVGGYIIAGSFAAILGGPISGVLLTYMNDFAGLRGWQWMFIVEGAPAVLLGLVTLCYLPNGPTEAKWLNEDERNWLETELRAERAAIESVRHYAVLDSIRDIRVWVLSILFGCALVGIYGMFIWLPLIIQGLGKLSYLQVGLLSAVPPLLGVIGTIVVSISSDRTGDRKFHLAVIYAIGGIGMLGSALVKDPVIAYVSLCVAGLGMNSGNSLFWSLNASFMTGVAGAVSIAVVNMIAQFGGLVGPWSIGLVKTATGSFSIALVVVAAFLFAASAIAAAMRVTPKGRSS
ncbi:MFS transporter [Telmatospirillum sp.]|uniref:MFS transporter n=1 Tax=Telmatospirillum sp. TaxID=2079197 RepID=UPI002849C2DD|nr:MFS transporter [Telmatospirillum sp.]MDR3437810.1 MFS transporter [Telmatospirillum sp.]